MQVQSISLNTAYRCNTSKSPVTGRVQSQEPSFKGGAGIFSRSKLVTGMKIRRLANKYAKRMSSGDMMEAETLLDRVEKAGHQVKSGFAAFIMKDQKKTPLIELTMKSPYNRLTDKFFDMVLSLDPDVQAKIVVLKNGRGYSPLHAAVLSHSSSGIKRVLNFLETLDTTIRYNFLFMKNGPDEESLLQLAVRSGSKENVELVRQYISSFPKRIQDRFYAMHNKMGAATDI